MTGREALETALNLTQQIEVKGKQNMANLLYVIQLLEGLLNMQNNDREGAGTDGNDNQKAVEN